MKLSSKITTAETLGLIAFEQGKKKAPCQCQATMDLLIGEKGNNSIKILEAWNKGFMKGKRIQMKAFFTARMKELKAS